MTDEQLKHAKVVKVSTFQIIGAASTAELSEKMSQKLDTGEWKLVGQPFVFKEHIHQAVTLLGRGLR